MRRYWLRDVQPGDRRTLSEVYRSFLRAFALASAGALFLVLLLVVWDVFLRNIGFQPPPHTIALAEYTLLFSTLLSAPWILHQKAHIHIEIVVERCTNRARRLIDRVICALGLLTCILIAWAASKISVAAALNGEFDLRSFAMPRFVLYGVVALSFGLMAIEFARMLARGESALKEGIRPDI